MQKEYKNNIRRLLKIPPVVAVLLLCFFTSCGVINKAAHEKLFSRRVVTKYLVSNRQLDSLMHRQLKSIDTFYYSKEQITSREVELIFQEGNPNVVTSYKLYVCKAGSNGKIAEVELYNLPLCPDGRLADPTHLKNGTGNAENKWLYMHNDKRDRAEIQYYKRNDGEDYELFSRTTYSYDKKRNMTEETCYYERGDTLRFNYEYDRKGNRLSQRNYDISNNIAQFYMGTLYSHNQQGDIETEAFFNEVLGIYSTKKYEYTYNDNGFWITKKEYRKDQLYSISEQQLEYYGVDNKGRGVDAEHLIQNEVWWYEIQVIHARGTRGIYAVYLYDDGRFVEKKVEQMSGKKYTRKGFYYYEPENYKVYLTYTDKKDKKKIYFPEKRTLTNPSSNDKKPVSWQSFLSVRKLVKGEKARYIK